MVAICDQSTTGLGTKHLFVKCPFVKACFHYGWGLVKTVWSSIPVTMNLWHKRFSSMLGTSYGILSANKLQTCSWQLCDKAISNLWAAESFIMSFNSEEIVEMTELSINSFSSSMLSSSLQLYDSHTAMFNGFNFVTSQTMVMWDSPMHPPVSATVMSAPHVTGLWRTGLSVSSDHKKNPETISHCTV